MHAKKFMMASTMYLGISGLMQTFLPGEIASDHNLSNPLVQLVFQILGFLSLP